MKASKMEVRMFSTCTTSAMEIRVNNWLQENPETEVHKIDFQVDKAVHAMVIYEHAKEVK